MRLPSEFDHIATGLMHCDEVLKTVEPYKGRNSEKHNQWMAMASSLYTWVAGSTCRWLCVNCKNYEVMNGGIVEEVN